jgi:hypothetical protein
MCFGLACILTLLCHLNEKEKYEKQQNNKISRLRDSSHRRGIRQTNKKKVSLRYTSKGILRGSILPIAKVGTK